MTLWGDNIAAVQENGVYEIMNVVVKEYPLDEFCLNSTSETSITRCSETVIKQIKPSFSLFLTRKFPLSNVTVSFRAHKCPRCGESVPLSDNRTDYFQCTKCSASSRFSKLPPLFTVKLAFPIPANGDDVTVFPALEEYSHKKQVDATDEAAIVISMILDEGTTILVNRKNICVAFI